MENRYIVVARAYEPLPVHLRYLDLPVHHQARGDPPQLADDFRLDQLYLLFQKRAAGLYLNGQWIAVSRGPALYDVCDIHVLAPEAD